MVALPLTQDVQAEAFTVQEHHDPRFGALHWGGVMKRGPLLGGKGTRQREWQLRQYFHHDYNLQFPSGVSVLVKQVQTTPWELVGPVEMVQQFQPVLMKADFGSWDRFISKAVVDYSRHDSGAWFELIGPGDPRLPIVGPISGIAVLDSLRVYPTGNPVYPAIYYDIRGRMHQMHKSRVVQLVDTEESEEDLAGYGTCALSRSISAVMREILMGRYIEQKLDDKPLPGVMVVGGLSPNSIEAAYRRMEQERGLDGGGEWGRVVRLYGLDVNEKPSVEFITNASVPEHFNFNEYTELNAREIALALGIDMQDVWGELTTSGLGQGTQSQVLRQKARGKGLGRLLKAFERVINQALPEALEFRWQYKDPEEDQEEATKAQTWIGVAQSAMASGVMTAEEARQLIANQVSGIQDVLLDAQGNLRRLPDDDPKPSEEVTATDIQQVIAAAAGDQPPSGEVEQIAANMGLTTRAFSGTAAEFSRRLVSFIRLGQNVRFNASVMRATLRDELYTAGLRSYEDGLKVGGADPADATVVEIATRRRKVAEWLAVQNTYITDFVDEINRDGIPREAMAARADMWINKSLRSIYYVGLNDAGGEKKYRWNLGNTIKHCKTCSLLNGQVHKLKDWMASGYTPGCTCLECKGFNCDCRFEQTDEKVRGRLPGTSPVASLTDRFTGFLQRMAGKAIEVPFAVHPDRLGRYLQRMAA